MASTQTLYAFEIPSGARAAFKTISQHKLLEVEKVLVPVMKEALFDWMLDVVEDTIANTKIKKRSGNLFQSLRDGPRVTGSSMDSIKGKYLANTYADVHEYGGEIRATGGGQVLCIPLPDALRPDGTPKLARPSSWKRYGTFSYQSKKTGRGYLAYKNAAGQLVLLYVFVESVKMLPKLGLRVHHAAALRTLVQAWGNILVQGMLKTDFYSLVKDPNKKLQWLQSDVKSIRTRFTPIRTY